MLSNITGVATRILLDRDALYDTALAVRMSWADGRSASREEDVAYSLIGICGVAMSVQYGEGAESAFLRLQEVLLNDCLDRSILAWRNAADMDHSVRGLLAKSPSEFRHFGETFDPAWQQQDWIFDGEIDFSSKEVRVLSTIIEAGPYIDLEVGRIRHKPGTFRRVAVRLQCWNGIHVRVNPESLLDMAEKGIRQIIHVARHIDLDTSVALDTHLREQTLLLLRTGPSDKGQDITSDPGAPITQVPERLAQRNKPRSLISSDYDFCDVSPGQRLTGAKRNKIGRAHV